MGNGNGSSCRILCYGDSLTAGYSTGTIFTPYALSLSDALGCEVSHCGIRGHTARQMAAEIHEAKVAHGISGRSSGGLGCLLDRRDRYDVVLLMVGTTDLGQGFSTESIVNSVRKLHAACHERGVPTIVLLPPSPNPARCALAGRLRTWACTEPRVLAVMDPEQLVPRSEHHNWDSDATHLSPAGYHALGKRLASDVHAALLAVSEAPCSEPIWQSRM